MTNAPPCTLVLGGTGKTGARVARKLTELGLSVRTAAPNGADVRFDWDDPATHSPALADVGRVYLLAPGAGPEQRTSPARCRASWISRRPGVRHVTYLSTFGIDQGPPTARCSAC